MYTYILLVHILVEPYVEAPLSRLALVWCEWGDLQAGVSVYVGLGPWWTRATHDTDMGEEVGVSLGQEILTYLGLTHYLLTWFSPTPLSTPIPTHYHQSAPPLLPPLPIPPLFPLPSRQAPRRVCIRVMIFLPLSNAPTHFSSSLQAVNICHHFLL